MAASCAWFGVIILLTGFRNTPMNPLGRSLIEKAGYGNGRENVRETIPARVVLFSARHKAEVQVHRPPKPARGR